MERPYRAIPIELIIIISLYIKHFNNYEVNLENEIKMKKEKISIINKRIRQIYKTRGPNLMKIPDLKEEKREILDHYSYCNYFGYKSTIRIGNLINDMMRPR